MKLIGRVDDYSVLAAAALHDILEDTKIPYNTLYTEFGEVITSLVVEMTQKDNDDFDTYLQQLSVSDPRTQTIKLADRLDNVQDLIRFKPVTFGNITPKQYLDQSIQILDCCGKANEALAEELKIAIDNAFHLFSL